MSRSPLLLSFAALLIVFCQSCCYHYGQSIPRTSCCLTEVRNLTTEARLSSTVRRVFHDELSRQPGLSLADEEQADLLVDLTVSSLDSRSIASSEIREAGDRDNDSEGYQAVLHRLALTIDYKIYRADSLDSPLLSGQLQGQADMPRMPDRNTVMRVALKQASGDVIRQLLEIIQVADFEETAP